MTLFIKRIFVLFMLATVIYAIAICTFFLYSKTQADFKIRSGVKYLAIGHSQIACGINDTLIDGMANAGRIAESYLYNLIKARQIIEQNEGVEVLIVDFSNLIAYKKMDNWIYDDGHIERMAPELLPFASLREICDLLGENPEATIEAMTLLPQKVIQRDCINQKSFVSDLSFMGFTPKTICKIDSLKANYKTPKKRVFKLKNIQRSLYYLKQIIQLAEENGIEVILIRPPLHERFEGMYYEDEFKALLEDPNIKKIRFIDFAEETYPDSLFFDFNHLNFQGANRFTLELKSELGLD